MEATFTFVTSKQIDMLTQDSVSIATKQYSPELGMFLGDNMRVAYRNSPNGRKKLSEDEPEYVVTAVLAMWGDSPTLEDDIAEETVEAVSVESEGDANG